MKEQKEIQKDKKHKETQKNLFHRGSVKRLQEIPDTLQHCRELSLVT